MNRIQDCRTNRLGPPIILPIFLPSMGCRERCLYCNQRASSKGPPSPSSVHDKIEAALGLFPRDKKGRETQIAFYGGSFTAIQRDDQTRYLKVVQPFLASGRIDSIRISTRPDALDEEALALLKEYGVKTVEIGVQSMVNDVLSLCHRGHGAEEVTSAFSRLRRWGFEVGIHLMIGLPGDSLHRFLCTLERTVDLRPDFLRVHPTLVLKGAPLEDLWRNGKYFPLPMEEAIQWLKRGVLRLEKASIPVARIGLLQTEELERDYLSGPYHPALRQLVDSAIAFDMAEYLLQSHPRGSQVLFLCHPKEVSNLRGQKNRNMLRLRTRFGLTEILVQAREDVQQGSLFLQTPTQKRSICRGSLRYEES